MTFGGSPSATLASYAVTPVSGPSITPCGFTNIPFALATSGGVKTLTAGTPASATNNGVLQMEGLFLGATGNHAGFAVNVTNSSLPGVRINAVEVFKEP